MREDKDIFLNEVIVLTHPVIAALDFPLCCAKREKKERKENNK
jgi:hypothetical protein